MPVHVNKIGDFQFLQMAGSVILRQEQLELIERHGVNGHGVRRLGKRGEPFTIQTVNYEDSFDSAAAKMDDYKDMVGQDPVTFKRMSVDEGEFLVLQVREVEKYAIFNSLGGLVGNEECCHVVAWTLLG